MWTQILQRFVKWVDPKLDGYRVHKKVKPYTPETLEDFIKLLQRTPKTVLSDSDRTRIAAAMNYDEKKVDDLMVPKSGMVFVKANETMGPLVLDKLYKSGFKNFPVVDLKEKVIGIIHTEALNDLTFREAKPAEKYADKHIYYLPSGASLREVVDEIERTQSYYYLVRDKNGQTIGFFTIDMLLNYLI